MPHPPRFKSVLFETSTGTVASDTLKKTEPNAAAMGANAVDEDSDP